MRPLKRLTKSMGNHILELSQFHAPEKEITREIKEDDAWSTYEVFDKRRRRRLEYL